jgi:hypothetical protein
MPIELFFNFIMGEQVTFRVSEWLLLDANWVFFNFIMGEQVTFW